MIAFAGTLQTDWNLCIARPIAAMEKGKMFRRLIGLIAIAVQTAFIFSMALAQEARPPAAASPEMTQVCPGLVAANEPRIIPAALNPDQVRITYVGHATFLIESPELVRIATDY